MNINVANNETARAYNNLQNSIDWVSADYDFQLNVLYTMKQLLIQANSHTVIFPDTPYTCKIKAGRMLDVVIDRIALIEHKKSMKPSPGAYNVQNTI